MCVSMQERVYMPVHACTHAALISEQLKCFVFLLPHDLAERWPNDGRTMTRCTRPPRAADRIARSGGYIPHGEPHLAGQAWSVGSVAPSVQALTARSFRRAGGVTSTIQRQSVAPPVYALLRGV
jgi:hypothetical protein